MSKKLFTNSVTYTVFNLLQKMFSFFLLPLYTTYLTTQDYGTINIIASFTWTANFIVAFSLYSAIMRFYCEYMNEKEKVRKFYSTLLNFVFLAGCAFTVLTVALNRLVVDVFFKGIQFYPTVFLGILGLCFMCIYNMYSNILKVQEKAAKFSVVSLVFFFVQLGFNIFTVVVMKWGANGILTSTCITYLIFCLYIFIDLGKQGLYALCIDRQMLKLSLKYSIPLIPHDTSTQISELVSKVFINNSSSLAAVGLYSIAVQFGALTDTVQSSVNAAVRPWVFQTLKKDETDSKQEISRLTIVMFCGYNIVFAGIALFSQEALILFTNKSYHVAWSLIPIIVVLYMIKMVYYFNVNILLYYTNVSKMLFTATLTGSILNVILSAVFIPLWGMYGSVYADIIAMLLRVGIILYICRDIKKIQYDKKKFYGLIMIGMATITVGIIPSYVLGGALLFENIIYKACIILLLAGIEYLVARDEIVGFIKGRQVNEY